MKNVSIALLLLAVALMAACSQHQARPERPPEPDPQARFEALAKRLQLTEEQRDPVKDILEKEHSKRKEIMDEFNGRDEATRKAMREKMEDLEWDTIKALSQRLTQEQIDEYIKYLEEEAKKREEHKDRPEGGPGGPGGSGGPGGPPPGMH